MSASQRVDKWLWHARFFKTRSLAAKIVAGGIRINGARTERAAAAVKPGDILTFSKDDHVRLIEVVAIGERRGPAPEAQALYTDLDPPQPRERPHRDAAREAGAGRPTKKERRQIDALRPQDE